jgi:hypothetical protein
VSELKIRGGLKRSDAIMTTSASKPPWTQADWFDRISAWIHDELERLGIVINGPIEQPHTRPWSTVLYVPTLEGAVYFKACAEVLAHEAVVTQALSLWLPDYLPKILATDPKHGWMLMADGGTTLREVIKGDRDIRHWEKLLHCYAELQIELADRLPDLLTLGIPNRQLAKLPELYEKLLDNKEMLLIDQPEGLTSAEHQRLLDMKTHIASQSEQLAASPVPESIHHGDFHDANIFLKDDHYIFFDWGDSSAAHPFFSLRTVFVSLENTLNFEEDAPEFDGLRDAYLGPWTQYQSRQDLLVTFDVAARLSPIISALGWNHVVTSLDESMRDDYAGAVPSLLQEYLSLEDRAIDKLSS